MMTSLADLFKDYKKKEAEKLPEAEKPLVQVKKKKKPRAKPKVRVKKEKTTKRETETVILTREELLQLLEKAVARGIQEGLRIAKEPSEKNVIEAIWNSEPSGVKLSNLVIVFGREKAKTIQSILDDLLRRNIIVKDRNGWHHINPRFAEQILEHYGIQFSIEEPDLIRRRIRHRFFSWDFQQPSL